jgi:hypothetical protein
MSELEPQVPPPPGDVVRVLLSDETWAVAAYERLLARDDVGELEHKLRYCLSSHAGRREALTEALGLAERRGAVSDPAPSFQPLDAQADLDLGSVLDALSACEAASLERCRAATSLTSGRLHELLSMRVLPAQVQTADISASLASSYRSTHDSIA